MARGIIIGIGIIFLIIAVIGYSTPISITLADTTVNPTIPQMVAFCDSGIGQFAQMSPQVVLVCSEYNNFMMGIYGSVLLGIILIIVGAVKDGKEKQHICPYCNFIGLTELELIKHKADNHLDKSPYKCKKCDFIGIAEQVLKNHYKEIHGEEYRPWYS